MILEKKSNRAGVAPKVRKGQRPCKRCRWFLFLDAVGRFGVCEKHEKPSDPRDCVKFRQEETVKL